VNVERVTQSSPADFDAIVEMLVATYDNHVFLSAVFPDPASRPRALRGFFTASLKDGLRAGFVYVVRADGKIVGAAIMYLPGAYPPPAWRMLLTLPDWLKVGVASPGGLWRLIQIKNTLEGLRPKQPHIYGYGVGIHPAYQRSGAGNLLQNQAMKDSDESGIPLYMETQRRSVLEWMKPRGFKVLREDVEMFPGGPRTWTVWRDPKPKSETPPAT
jgi:hypothetical protein